MKVKKIDVKQDGLLGQFPLADCADAYECRFVSDKIITADDIQIDFWTGKPPAWVQRLFELRNFLVKPFGLDSSSGRDTEAFRECIRTGGSYGIADIPAKSENETVLRLRDSHLDAYISAKLEHDEKNKKLIITTLVNFHNKTGRAYFFFIKPFHAIVVKMMLKNTIKKYL